MNQETKSKSFFRQYKWMTILLLVLSIILAGVSIFQNTRARALAQEMENQYVRAFHDMTDYVRDVDTLLKKTLLSSDATQISALSAEIFMQTASAKSCLSQLPTESEHLGSASKFLSQLGDYASYLSSKVLISGKISDEEFLNLSELSKHATAVNNTLTTLEDKLYSQEMSLTSVIGMTAYANEDEAEAVEPDGIYRIEKDIQNYPALIYDGPFSEHIETMEPMFLKGKTDYTKDQAKQIAQSFLKDKNLKSLDASEDVGGRISCYSFVGTKEDNSKVYISITKTGGMVLWMLDARSPEKSVIDAKTASSKGLEYLTAIGIVGMKESYYEKSDNTLTVNYAYEGQGIIMYSDLIKLKIALDSGEILGIETRGYLMSHHERSLPLPTLSESDARSKVNSHLTIDSVRLALIPLDSKREVLCYECKGSFEDQNYLIYLNAQTGHEEKILLLLESDDGVLTI